MIGDMVRSLIGVQRRAAEYNPASSVAQPGADGGRDGGHGRQCHAQYDGAALRRDHFADTGEYAVGAVPAHRSQPRASDRSRCTRSCRPWVMRR